MHSRNPHFAHKQQQQNSRKPNHEPHSQSFHQTFGVHAPMCHIGHT
uniref:Uncharacterized protein n=1 Tax=Rhizophora mucronata TaxID=61149 RepID=A0A2P2R2K3_RHIMU